MVQLAFQKIREMQSALEGAQAAEAAQAGKLTALGDQLTALQVRGERGSRDELHDTDGMRGVRLKMLLTCWWYSGSDYTTA